MEYAPIATGDMLWQTSEFLPPETDLWMVANGRAGIVGRSGERTSSKKGDSRNDSFKTSQVGRKGSRRRREGYSS